MSTAFRTYALVSIVVATAGCATTWRTELSAGEYGSACQLVEEIEDDQRHGAARMRISREYTAASGATVTIERKRFEQPALDQYFDRQRYVLLVVRSDAPARLRAAVIDGHVWLAVPDEQLPRALPDTVGLDVSERPAPLAQSAAESADRKVRQWTKGGVDPKLRQRDFGVVPVCPAGATDCKPRRTALRELQAVVPGASGCESGEECARLVLLKKARQTTADPLARLELNWRLDGCEVSHVTDIPPSGTADSEALSRGWTMADRELDLCAMDGFETRRCEPE